MKNFSKTGDSQFMNYTNFFWGGGQRLGSDQETKTMCRNGWEAWRLPYSTKAYQSWSNDTKSAIMYIAAMRRSSLM
jgi:hypothetical protein